MSCESKENRVNREIINNHPCFSEKAQSYFSRIHLPVAPRCNIQCNYCNRKYDCSNESRPGVTSQVLSPKEALQKIMAIANKRKDLSVVGIAGPGDALANPDKAFETFRLIRQYFPDLLLCLSTNGLKLVDYINDIKELGIDHITVTLNTFDPLTAKKIYSWVRVDGVRSNDPKALSLFLNRQQEGIKALVQQGILVKVNSLLIPGINELELPSLSKRLKLMGVSIHNIMPLISKPEYGTLFSKQGQPVPTNEQLEETRKACGILKQMAHCRQCRADAVGKLGDENQLQKENTAVDGNDFGFSARENWRYMANNMMNHQLVKSIGSVLQNETLGKNIKTGKVGVCTNGTGYADLEIGTTKDFFIYEWLQGKLTLLNIRRLDGEETDDRMQCVLKCLKGCSAVLSKKIGYKMFKSLESSGILPVSDLSEIPLTEAVKITLQRLNQKDCVPSQTKPNKTQKCSSCV